MTHSGNLVIARVYGVLENGSFDIVLHKEANVNELKRRIQDVFGEDVSNLKLIFPPENLDVDKETVTISDYINNENIYPFYFESDGTFKKIQNFPKLNLPPKVISQTTMKKYSLNSKTDQFFDNDKKVFTGLQEKEPNAEGDELEKEKKFKGPQFGEDFVAENLLFDGPPIVHIIIQDDKIIEAGQYSSPKEAQDAKFNLAFNTAPNPKDDGEDSRARRNKEILSNLSYLKKSLPMTKMPVLDHAPKTFHIFNQEVVHFRGLRSSLNPIIPDDPEHIVVNSLERKSLIEELLNQRFLQIEEFKQLEDRYAQSQLPKIKLPNVAQQQQTRKKTTLRRSARPTLNALRLPRQAQHQQQEEVHQSFAIPHLRLTSQQQQQQLQQHHQHHHQQQQQQQSQPSHQHNTSQIIQRQAFRSSAYNKYGILAALRKFHAIKEEERQKEKKFSSAETVRFFGTMRPISFYRS